MTAPTPTAPPPPADAPAPAENLTVAQLAATLRPSSPPVNPAPAAGPDEPPAAPAAPPVPPAESPEGSTPETPDAPPDAPEAPAPEAAETTEPAEEDPAPPRAALPPELAEALQDAKLGKGVKDILKRVHTVADQRDAERNARLAAEDRARTLDAALAELKANPPPVPTAPSGTDPLAAHPEMRWITDQIADMDAVLDWTDRNPDGGMAPDGKGGEIEMDRDQVARLRRQAETQRTERVAERGALRQSLTQQHRQAEAHWNSVAEANAAWLKDPNAPEQRHYAAALKAFPELKRSPAWKVFAVAAAEGMVALEARAANSRPPLNAGPRKAKPATVPTPQAGRPVAAPPRSEPGDKEVEAAEAELAQTGSTEALAKTFAAQRRLAHQR